jgi:hypothetical protein
MGDRADLDDFRTVVAETYGPQAERVTLRVMAWATWADLEEHVHRGREASHWNYVPYMSTPDSPRSTLEVVALYSGSLQFQFQHLAGHPTFADPAALHAVRCAFEQALGAPLRPTPRPSVPLTALGPPARLTAALRVADSVMATGGTRPWTVHR